LVFVVTWVASFASPRRQFGLTGFPLVDAAMRQLWCWGWCPNYLRHVAASFLVEHLNLDWRHGCAWFHDTLVDADPAINAFMWQNGGRSGLDQARRHCHRAAGEERRHRDDTTTRTSRRASHTVHARERTPSHSALER
jgi:deoxyribodipyrimidine photolyase